MSSNDTVCDNALGKNRGLRRLLGRSLTGLPVFAEITRTSRPNFKAVGESQCLDTSVSSN